MRRFIADAIYFEGNCVDIGSGNGLFAAMLQEVYPDSELYGVDRSELDLKVTGLMFSNKANHFVMPTYFRRQPRRHKSFLLIFPTHLTPLT